jgi:hypothetical protein
MDGTRWAELEAHGDGARRIVSPCRREEVSMINKALAAGCAALIVSAPAFAETAAPPPNTARYSFQKVAGGFLRLDTETGEVALCSARPVGWACLAAPEDRAVLESEIARLRRDNAALKHDLLAHGLPLPPGTLPEPAADDSDKNVTVRLPDQSDVNRVLAFVGRVWHRLVDALAHAQDRVLHKG